ESGRGGTAAGFSVQPLAIRMKATELAWPDAGTLPDAAFDVRVGFETDAPAVLRALELVALDATWNGDGFSGAVQPLSFDPALRIPLGGADGPAFLLTGLQGRLDGAANDQGAAHVTMRGRFELPDALACAGGTSSFGLPAELALSGSGRIDGRIQGVEVPCSLRFGELELDVRTCDLILRSDTAQIAELELQGDVRLPGVAGGAPVTSSGALVVDLIGGRIARGAVDIRGPFRWGVPADEPLLSFVVERARLDAAGLRLSGRGGLDTSQDGAGSAVRAEVTFDDLT